MQTKYYVALDRDGTLIKLHHYLSDPNLVELLPGVATSLRRLRNLGLGLVIVTNQSAIGRGYFDKTRLEAIHQRLTNLLADEDITLDGLYFCPHTPDDDCVCRKPKPGMLHKAAKDLNFNLSNCFMVGDNASDIEAGQHVGATTFLVRTGYGLNVETEGKVTPNYIADNLENVTDIIRDLI